MGEGHCFLSPQWASWDSPRAIMSPMAESSPPPMPSHQPSGSTEGPPKNGKIEEGVARPGRIESFIRRVENFSRITVFSVPFCGCAKVRQRPGCQGGARRLLRPLSLFPLLLVFTTILGYALHDNKKLQEDLINSALGNFPIIGSELHFAHPCPHWKRRSSGRREHSPHLWRSWARAGDPERDERRMEHSLRSLALHLPALPASAGGPHSARSLHHWGDGTHRVRILVSHGWIARVLLVVGSLVVNFGLILLAFNLTTADALKWHNMYFGTALATVFGVRCS